MKKFVFALGLALTTAAPLWAGGLTFQPVEPTGLDAKAGQMVEALQAGMPGQMAAFEQAGYGHYGAVAVPTGVALKPEFLASVANLETPEAAEAKVLEVCKAQTGYDCTVIGLLMPGEG